MAERTRTGLIVAIAATNGGLFAMGWAIAGWKGALLGALGGLPITVPMVIDFRNARSANSDNKAE